MQAGFDLSEMNVYVWEALLAFYNISDKPVKTDKGWIWKNRDLNGNFVVTSNDPISGLSYHNRYGEDNPQTGYLGYVGIEGDAGFVARFFVDFKEVADSFKDEEFGKRSFI